MCSMPRNAPLGARYGAPGPAPHPSEAVVIEAVIELARRDYALCLTADQARLLLEVAGATRHSLRDMLRFIAACAAAGGPAA